MFKALAILAVSMTATTVLLTHLEPAASQAIASPLPDRIQRFVQSAVASAEPIVAESWSGLDIVSEIEGTVSPCDTLVASSPGREAHFRIGDSGEVWSSCRWLDQTGKSAGRVIRIAMADRKAGSPLSPLQRAALRRLLIELKGLLLPGGTPDAGVWHVTLSDDLARDGVLQDYLRSEGWLG